MFMCTIFRSESRASGRRGTSEKKRSSLQMNAYSTQKKIACRGERSTRASTTIVDLTITDESSSDEDDDDEDWVIEKFIGSAIKKKIKRATKLPYGLYGDAGDDDMDDDEECRSKFQFAYELHGMDEAPSFQRQYLVAIEFEADTVLKNMSVDELMKKFKKGNFAGVKSVTIIPRCENGQVYIFVGLRSKLHFTVGPKGYSKLVIIFSKSGVLRLVPNRAVFADSSELHLCPNLTCCKTPAMSELMEYAVAAAREWVPILLDCDVKKRDRVDYSVNLGLTDQK